MCLQQNNDNRGVGRRSTPTHGSDIRSAMMTLAERRAALYSPDFWQIFMRHMRTTEANRCLRHLHDLQRFSLSASGSIITDA
jgi:hypothetical protein